MNCIVELTIIAALAFFGVHTLNALLDLYDRVKK
jgi:hypothetical protein